MQILIKLEVDSKLNKELTKDTIKNCITQWIANHGGYFPIAQDNDNDPENLIELDSISIN